MSACVSMCHHSKMWSWRHLAVVVGNISKVVLSTFVGVCLTAGLSVDRFWKNKIAVSV